MKSLKKHYFWVIAIIVLLQHMVSGGINNNMPSLFIVPVTQELGISRGVYSLAFSLKSISAMISTALSGGIMLRFGYRKPVLASLVLSLTGMIILSVSNNGAVYAFGSIVLGLGDGICISAGAAKIVSSWFHSRKGTVLGLITAGTGIGGSITCIWLSNIIAGSGWRSAYLFNAGLIICIIVIFSIFLKDSPEDVGLKPYGMGELEKNKTAAGKDWWPGFSMAEIVRKPLFYMMCVGTLLSCVCGTMVLNVLVAHLQDRGIPSQNAVAMQSVVLLLLAGFKIIFGAASDRYGVRPVMIICLAAEVVSLVLFAMISSNVIAWIAIVVYAAALPVTTVVIPLLSASLFGYRVQMRCVGIFFTMVQISSVITQPIENMFYDQIGSYAPVFLGAAVVSLILIILYLTMYKLSDMQRKQMETE